MDQPADLSHHQAALEKQANDASEAHGHEIRQDGEEQEDCLRQEGLSHRKGQERHDEVEETTHGITHDVEQERQPQLDQEPREPQQSCATFLQPQQPQLHQRQVIYSTEMHHWAIARVINSR